jgi:serine/threonine protein kinase
MTPAVGETVADRSEVREHLGSGGFATVWRAHDRQADRDVALKCADDGTHDAAAVRDRFAREVATLGRFEGAITPASVVRFLDADLTASPAYIALEYLPGDALSDALGTGQVGTSVRQRIVADVAWTIDFLHRNGVVYLDLKPENLILRDSGRPVLVDFNTAATVDATVETRFEADQFKPPECLADSPVDTAPGPRSDVYAWGKLAFYLLTGAKVMPADVPDEGVDPRSFGGDCSLALADAILRATRPDPLERHEDGVAVAEAVAAATGLGPRTVLTHDATDVACPVLDDTTTGRLEADSTVPWVVLPDPESHVSPRHARFAHTADGWVLADTSLNGTYVGGPDDWTFVLSEDGFQARKERGRTDPGADPPPTSRPLPVGTHVAPVHPEYGLTLRHDAPE